MSRRQFADQKTLVLNLLRGCFYLCFCFISSVSLSSRQSLYSSSCCCCNFLLSFTAQLKVRKEGVRAANHWFRLPDHLGENMGGDIMSELCSLLLLLLVKMFIQDIFMISVRVTSYFSHFNFSDTLNMSPAESYINIYTL